MEEPPSKRPRPSSSSPAHPTLHQVMARGSCPNGALFLRGVAVLECFLDEDADDYSIEKDVRVLQDVFDEIARAGCCAENVNIVSGHAFSEETTVDLVREAMRLSLGVPLSLGSADIEEKQEYTGGSRTYFAAIVSEKAIGFLKFEIKEKILVQYSLVVFSFLIADTDEQIVAFNTLARVFFERLLAADFISKTAPMSVQKPLSFIRYDSKHNQMLFGVYALYDIMTNGFDKTYDSKDDFLNCIESENISDVLSKALGQVKMRNEMVLKEFPNVAPEDVILTEGAALSTIQQFQVAIDAVWSVPSWAYRLKQKGAAELQKPIVYSTSVSAEEMFIAKTAQYVPPQCHLFAPIQHSYFVICARVLPNNEIEVIVGFPTKLPESKRFKTFNVGERCVAPEYNNGFRVNRTKPSLVSTAVPLAQVPALVCAFSTLASDKKIGAEHQFEQNFTRMQSSCVDVLVNPSTERKTGQATTPLWKLLQIVISAAKSRNAARPENAPPASFRGILISIEDVMFINNEYQKWRKSFAIESEAARVVQECQLNALNLREQLIFTQRCLNIDILLFQPSGPVTFHSYTEKRLCSRFNWTLVVKKEDERGGTPWKFLARNKKVVLLTPSEAEDVIFHLDTAEWLTCDEHPLTFIQSIGCMITSKAFQCGHTWEQTSAEIFLRSFSIVRNNRIGEWKKMSDRSAHAIQSRVDACPRRFAGWFSEKAAAGDLSHFFMDIEMHVRSCDDGYAVLLAPHGSDVQVMAGESGTTWMGQKDQWVVGWRFQESRQTICINVAFSSSIQKEEENNFSFSCQALRSVIDRMRQGPQKMSEQLLFQNFHPATLGQGSDELANVHFMESVYERGELRKREVNLLYEDRVVQDYVTQPTNYCFVIPYGREKAHEIVFVAREKEYRILLWDAHEQLV